MLRSASNNAVAESRSWILRDKAKERRVIVSLGEKHAYMSLRPPISQIFLGLCDDAILRPSNNATTSMQWRSCCGVCLSSLSLSLSLYNFVEIGSLCNTTILRNDKSIFFFSSKSSWNCVLFIFMLLLLCQNISRVGAKPYWNKHSTSRRLDWSSTCRLFSSDVSDQGTDNWWELMYLLELFLLELFQHVV